MNLGYHGVGPEASSNSHCLSHGQKHTWLYYLLLTGSDRQKPYTGISRATEIGREDNVAGYEQGDECGRQCLLVDLIRSPIV